MAKYSPSHPPLWSPSLVVVYGTIRDEGDPEGVRVSLSIWSDSVTLRKGRDDLGRWDFSGVSLTQIGESNDYILTAEGDHLMFSPDDPSEVRNLPFVTTDDMLEEEKIGRRWLRSRSKKGRRSDSDGGPVDESAAESIPLAATTDSEDAASGQLPANAVSEAESATNRKPAVRAAVGSVRGLVHDDVELGATEVEESWEWQQSPRPETVEAPRVRNLSIRVWTAALDQCRRFDLFGLNRVPVSESTRFDRDHTHTWDHRVAASRGVVQHICTACGWVRGRTARRR